MKIYIASRFECLNRLRPLRDELRKLGHEIVSTWLDEVPKPDFLSSKEFSTKLAIKDLVEVRSADCIIVDTIEVTNRGGRENEFGFALNDWMKLWIVVGPIRTIFHRLADHHFESWDALLLYFREHYNLGEFTPESMVAGAGNDGKKFLEVGAKE